VLHELAHMWFGDLVTMRWWDDLWLNESFATYVAFLCLDRATRFTSAWRVFNGTLKPEAYRLDQMATTHPVAADAPDTDLAELNFDAITYEKGAAVLKQLVATIGLDAFTAGLRTYFERHAWGNATLDDFLGSLASASARPLDDWARAWLGTASLNTIGASWSASDGAIGRFALEQTAPDAHPILRPHALRVALVSEVAGALRIASLPVQVDGATTAVPDAIGRPAPALVFPNHDDHDYALARLDPVSVAFVRSRIDEVEDRLLRQQLWTSLWQMVRDGSVRSTDYLATVRRCAPREPDTELLAAILSNAARCLRAFVPESLRDRETRAYSETARAAVAASGTRDAGVMWLRSAILACGSADDLAPLLERADAPRPDEIPVDQQMRWDLAVKSVALGMPGAAERVATERARDGSDRGDREVIRAASATPTADAKRTAWDRIHGEGYGSYHLTRAAMIGFQWPWQRELLTPYRDRFFASLRPVFATHDVAFAKAYLAHLAPVAWAEPDVLSAARDVLGSLGDGEAVLRRQLLELCDELERAIAVRAIAEAAGQG
jgi:aminopeptidase N